MVKCEKRGIAMKNKQPIFFDENRPFAHYEAAGKLKKAADKAMLFGKIFPIVILPIGIACVAFDPFYMALYALFGILFTVLAFIGCSIRRIGYTLLSIPFAIGALAVMLVSGSDFFLLGTFFYLIATISQFRVLYAISDFYMLKELPGFPFFDPGMDDISFAAMEHHGADEFVEGELCEDRAERIKLVPIEPPSDEMGEILTDDIYAPVNLKKFPEEQEDGPTAYEKMINTQVPEREEVSDIDLFY